MLRIVRRRSTGWEKVMESMEGRGMKQHVSEDFSLRLYHTSFHHTVDHIVTVFILIVNRSAI